MKPDTKKEVIKQLKQLEAVESSICFLPIVKSSTMLAKVSAVDRGGVAIIGFIYKPKTEGEKPLIHVRRRTTKTLREVAVNTDVIFPIKSYGSIDNTCRRIEAEDPTIYFEAHQEVRVTKRLKK